MGIKDINERYEEKISIRNSLSTIGQEIDALEQNEVIKRYTRLLNYYDRNKRLEDKTDNELLDESIQSSDPVPELESTYFCMGKEYFGHSKKAGGYYLSYGNKFQAEVQLAFYKRLTGKPLEELIPLAEVEEFEKTHEIIYAQTKDPQNEFTAVRRQLHQELIQKEALKEEGPKLSLTRED